MSRKIYKHTKENKMDLKKTIPIENMYDLASTKFDITILRKINKSYGSLVTDYEANLIYSSYEGQIWNLKLNLGTFEVMHGLYRICRLVANKLDVAFEINLEKLPNPNDDGSFLVDLVSDLCIFYRDMHFRQTEFDKEMTVEKTILYSTRNAPFRSSPRFQAKLASIINTMLSKLKAFKKRKNIVRGINSSLENSQWLNSKFFCSKFNFLDWSAKYKLFFFSFSFFF